jgi:hypothetical protein
MQLAGSLKESVDVLDVADLDVAADLERENIVSVRIEATHSDRGIGDVHPALRSACVTGFINSFTCNTRKRCQFHEKPI